VDTRSDRVGEARFRERIRSRVHGTIPARAPGCSPGGVRPWLARGAVDSGIERDGPSPYDDPTTDAFGQESVARFDGTPTGEPPQPPRWVLALVHTLGLLAVGAALTWFAALPSTLADIQEQNANLQAEIRDLTTFIGDTPTEARVAEAEARRSAIGGLVGQRGSTASRVRSVAGAVPVGAWLVRLTLQTGRLELEGRSHDPAAAADLMDGLRATGCFDEIELVSVDAAASSRSREASPAGRFVVTATESTETCGATRGELRDPFRSPHAASDGPRDPSRPPLYRWEPSLYRVTAIVPGRSATVSDPLGGRHSLTVGGALGNPAATVTFITEDTVILSRDESASDSTDRLSTRLIELVLDPREP